MTVYEFRRHPISTGLMYAAVATVLDVLVGGMPRFVLMLGAWINGCWLGLALWERPPERPRL